MPEIMLDTLRNDTQVFAAALTFAKRMHTEESIRFYYDKSDMKTIYEKYIIPDAPFWVNLANPLVAPMHKLAEVARTSPAVWKDPTWTNLIADARKSIKAMWDFDVKPRFLESPEFKATPFGKKQAAAASAEKAAASAKTAVKLGATTLKAAAVAVSGQKEEKPEVVIPPPTMKTAEKAAKLHGIDNTKKLFAAMTASYNNDPITSEKLMAQLAKEEEVDVKKALTNAKLDKELKKALQKALKR